MAEVIPFPVVRRVDFVWRHAARMSELRAKAAENHLASQLKIQRDTMTRKGVDPERIDQELATLEAAIRAELWRLVLSPGGAA
jgi:hypothetical protein